MRSLRRRFLNLAGAFFLIALLLRIVFLITGLRSYAARPEIPFRILEMAAVLCAALYAYLFSYRYGFLLMTPACGILLVATIREINNKTGSVGFFDYLPIVGLALMLILSVMNCPLFERSYSIGRTIWILSVLTILIFASEMIYQIVTLVNTLYAETYPGEFTTKYYYPLAVTYFALVLTGVACLFSANIRPSDHSKNHEHHEHHKHRSHPGIFEDA